MAMLHLAEASTPMHSQAFSISSEYVLKQENLLKRVIATEYLEIWVSSQNNMFISTSEAVISN